MAEMKLLRSVVLFGIFICSLVAHAADQAPGAEKCDVYGVKGASTILVRITGGGVRRPGIYYIQSGATLHDLIANDKAEWLRLSNGRFRITRGIKGEKITIERDYHQWDMILLDGDDIYAESMMDVKRPNQPSRQNSP
jgi:protein involved in polysaccharide export with SLBB domain